MVRGDNRAPSRLTLYRLFSPRVIGNAVADWTSLREFGRIPEDRLEESKRKVISDIPLEVRQTVCYCLDGKYLSLNNGQVAFAIEMNIREVEARRADDT
ncbi:hypothetical protein LSAT2_012110 [Lamellibrachia satsuma]|nr:hypothetical protein LSAT2_012110 [Lamellibrachia satsuma]